MSTKLEKSLDIEVFDMNDYLYHKANHKYTRRIWRNGKWVYYYDDGSKTVGYPKGQNYSVKKSTTDDSSNNTAKAVNTKKTNNSKSKKSLESYIRAGKEKIDELDFIMRSSINDLIQKTKNKSKEDTASKKPIGQNYSVRSKQ